jgi:hypothetical protein
MSRAFCLLRQRRRLESTAGAVRAAWNQAAGGVLELEAGGLTASLELEVRGAEDGRRYVLSQRDDHAPRLLPLEEGPARVGIRALFSLYDDHGRLHGDGMQETWITRHGEVFLAFGLRLVPQGGFAVTDALVRCTLGGLVGAACHDGAQLRASGAEGSVLLGWPTGRGRRFDTLLWRSPRPPFYERWPPYFDQWSLAPESFGWDRRPSSGASVKDGAELALAWLRDEEVAARPSLDLRGLLWCGFGEQQRLEGLLDAHERPQPPVVTCGDFRSYDELDGAFEVAAHDGVCELEVPADAQERPVRIRIFGLAGAAYSIEPVGAGHLTSGETRTDDPLVALPIEPDAPADEAIIDLVTRPDAPTRVAVRARRAGLQLAYQRRDDRRRLTVHHPLDPDRAVCTIDLAGVRLRGLRLPGVERPALYDLPLYWMRYLAKASAHSANWLEEVAVLDDGPERVSLRICSTTPDERVRSRYELTFPYVEDRMELRLRAHLIGADAWDLPTFEYADLFPAGGIDAGRWDYDRLAFVGLDEMRIYDPRDPYPFLKEQIALPAGVLEAMTTAHAQPDAGPWSFGERAAVVFHGSDRGTLLAVASNPQGVAIEHVATLCEHWMDVHLDVTTSGRAPVSSEAEGRAGAVAKTGPHKLLADLRLVLLSPSAASFEGALDLARELLVETESTASIDCERRSV